MKTKRVLTEKEAAKVLEILKEMIEPDSCEDLDELVREITAREDDNDEQRLLDYDEIWTDIERRLTEAFGGGK